MLFLLVIAAHTTASLLLLRAGIGTYLGGPASQQKAVGIAAALSFAGLPAAALAFPRFTWGAGDTDIRIAVILLLGGALTFAMTPMLRMSALLGVIVAGAAVSGGLSLGVGLRSPTRIRSRSSAFTCRISVWTLGLGWEIDRSRAVTAQLAIAEERLRFARDLHDAWAATCRWSRSRASWPRLWRPG